MHPKDKLPQSNIRYSSNNGRDAPGEIVTHFQSALVDFNRLRPEKAETDFAVSTHSKGVHTLHRRLFQYAISCTVTARNTGVGVNLPDGISLFELAD